MSSPEGIFEVGVGRIFIYGMHYRARYAGRHPAREDGDWYMTAKAPSTPHRLHLPPRARSGATTWPPWKGPKGSNAAWRAVSEGVSALDRVGVANCAHCIVEFLMRHDTAHQESSIQHHRRNTGDAG